MEKGGHAQEEAATGQRSRSGSTLFLSSECSLHCSWRWNREVGKNGEGEERELGEKRSKGRRGRTLRDGMTFNLSQKGLFNELVTM